MNDCPQENAFAIFGSAARGDSDSFSDRDLLIISENETSTKAQIQVRLCRLVLHRVLLEPAATCHQGSLFVQHLKQESKILADPSDRLAHLLDQYSPRGNYNRESNGSASLLGNLTQHMPRCREGPMWAVDILSVGFRSLAVTKLADNGIYAFSNSEIIEGLARIGILNKEDGYQLSLLRRFKSLYRQGVIDEQITWYVVFNWMKIIDRIFTLGLDAQRVGTIALVELALANSSNAQTESNWYMRCRRIESALWMLKKRHKCDLYEFRKQRQYLFADCQIPNTYAWHFTSGYELIQGRLSELVEMCTV